MQCQQSCMVLLGPNLYCHHPCSLRACAIPVILLVEPWTRQTYHPSVSPGDMQSLIGALGTQASTHPAGSQGNGRGGRRRNNSRKKPGEQCHKAADCLGRRSGPHMPMMDCCCGITCYHVSYECSRPDRAHNVAQSKHVQMVWHSTTASSHYLTITVWPPNRSTSYTLLSCPHPPSLPPIIL